MHKPIPFIGRYDGVLVGRDSDSWLWELVSSRMHASPQILWTVFNPLAQLGARLAVKNARWSMRPQKAGDGLDSMVEFQVQIKGHNQREYEDRWQGWQNWTDEKLATKLTKNDQQPVLLLPARWWPDTLPEFESGGWWQRPHKRVRCRQCKCSLVENPSFKSSKCQLVLLYRSISGTYMIFITEK